MACALGVAPPLACAQSTPENDRVARTEFTAGRDAFSHGDFEQAVRRFEHAFQLSGRRELLYNIGTAYERLHRWEPARDAFQGYLAAFPNAPERDEVRGRLTSIDGEIERERQRAASPSPAPQRIEVVRERVVVREVPSESHPLRVAGIVVGGLGVIAGAVSLTVGLVTNGHYDELVNTCGQTVEGCPAPVIEDVQLRATLTNAFAATAGVLVAAGVALVIVDVIRPQTRRVEQRTTAARGFRFGFAPQPQGAGFVLMGSF